MAQMQLTAGVFATESAAQAANEQLAELLELPENTPYNDIQERYNHTPTQYFIVIDPNDFENWSDVVALGFTIVTNVDNTWYPAIEL